MKIGRRLALAFGLLLLSMVVIIAFSIARMSSMAGAVEYQNWVRTQKLEPLYAAREALAQTGLTARNALAIADEAEAKRELDKMDAARDVYLAALKKAASQFANDGEFDKVNTGLLRMAQELNRVRPLRMANDTRKFADFIANECRPMRNQIVNDMDVLLQRVQNDVVTASLSAEALFRKSIVWMLATGGLALVASIVVGIAITRSITTPLQQAVKVAETVAAGDLTTRLDRFSSDETGSLQRALQQMNDKLLEIIGGVRIGTDAIATASSEIAAGNLDLSVRTEQQAGSLEATATSMEKLTLAVRQTAESASQANLMATSASDVALKGGEVVRQVVTTMGDIDAAARKIEAIIATIDSIAFQTNILALNAAVEAARAGEQGRGFAIVAAEVRSLAQRSASAAKEIKLLIVDSVDKVDTGSKLVAEAGSTMHDIVASVQRVNSIMAEIMKASQVQSSDIDQVNLSIVDMDQSTQQNTALVEQAAAAAESMREQAQKLSTAVSAFRLD